MPSINKQLSSSNEEKKKEKTALNMVAISLK